MSVRVGVAGLALVLLFCLANCDLKYMTASLNGKIQLSTLLLFYRHPHFVGVTSHRCPVINRSYLEFQNVLGEIPNIIRVP